MRAVRLALTASALLLAGCAAPGGPPAAGGLAAPEAAWVATAIAADKAGLTYPGYVTVRSDATLAQAYAAQRMLVARRYGPRGIGGFKGGFASPEALARFGIASPVVGILPVSGKVAAPYRLALAQFRKLVIECEIGFELARDIERPLADEAETRAAVARLGPAIELPDVALDPGAQHPLADHVAANISAARYIFVPSATPADAGDINALRCDLSHGGVTIGADSARKAYGDQWRALRAILNGALEAGYRPVNGQIVLTGAIVQTEARAGEWKADYGPFGKVGFTVE